MTLYGSWQRYGTLVAVNCVGFVLIVDLAIRGSRTLSGFFLLALVVSDLFIGMILRGRSESPVQALSGRRESRFFRFFGSLLLAGGLLRLALGFRKGIAWTDLVVFAISVLLAVAMLSIGRRMNLPTGLDQREGRQSRLP